jgi:hypothetical protein
MDPSGCGAVALGMLYDPRHLVMRDRRAAFDAFIQDATLPTSHGAIEATEAAYYEGGRSAAEHLLALPQPPMAILGANDQMAIGAIHAAWRRGLRSPPRSVGRRFRRYLRDALSDPGAHNRAPADRRDRPQNHGDADRPPGWVPGGATNHRSLAATRVDHPRFHRAPQRP